MPSLYSTASLISQVKSVEFMPFLGKNAPQNDNTRVPESQASSSGEFPLVPQEDEAVSAPKEADAGLYNSLGNEKFPRRGRPIKRPWFQRGKLGTLPVTRSIDKETVASLIDAAQHAEVIGKPLNVFITIRPENIDAITPEERSKFWIEERECLAQWFRDQGSKLTHLWSRESKAPDGTGEHMHMLCHVPKRLQAVFKAYLKQRYPEPKVLDVQPASTLAKRTENGRHHSVVGYVVKGMSPQAQWGSSMSRRAGGPIAGIRAGMSRDIGPKAIATWQATHQMATAA